MTYEFSALGACAEKQMSFCVSPATYRSFDGQPGKRLTIAKYPRDFDRFAFWRMHSLGRCVRPEQLQKIVLGIRVVSLAEASCQFRRTEEGRAALLIRNPFMEHVRVSQGSFCKPTRELREEALALLGPRGPPLLRKGGPKCDQVTVITDEIVVQDHLILIFLEEGRDPAKLRGVGLRT
jgi:hypothetical protein